jgi:hypothetical protein
MAFSNEEIKTAQGLIAQHRKFAQQWKVVRWLVLLVGVLMLVVMVFAYQQLRNVMEVDAFTLGNAVSKDDLKTMLFERVDVLRVELKLYFMVFLHAALGPILILTTLYYWNRASVQFTLKAKLLEMALKDEGDSKPATTKKVKKTTSQK